MPRKTTSAISSPCQKNCLVHYRAHVPNIGGSLPINDFFAKNGNLREDGRMVHDMHLVEVKTPSESSGLWDYYKIIDPRRSCVSPGWRGWMTSD
jgi:hypothetical protein